ncbi:unnamed protein product [Knipowitschia caucasica]|uniref:Uncharacterized protein n=1 Tax=Knipowitschia caucasica TaxID=637954 RepID=A0AAV2KS33_KNICA
MTTYFQSREFCCSPKKPHKSAKSKSKTGKGHHHTKHHSNFLTPNHHQHNQPSPLHSPKKHSLLPSPSPSYYHIPGSSYQLAPPSPNLVPHSPSYHQLHVSPSHHQMHLSLSQHQMHVSPSQHQLHACPGHHHLPHNHHHLGQPGLFHHHCLPPPLPHASQSLSIHPFHHPLPMCAALAGYGYSTLPTHLAHAHRSKSPKDAKKSPSKGKKGKGKPWPKDTYIWTSRCDVPHANLVRQLAPLQVRFGNGRV